MVNDKNTKPSTAKVKRTIKKKPQKESCVGKLMDYYGLTYWNRNHMTEPVAEAIAKDYFDWVCQEEGEAITIRRFAKLRGIPISKWYTWEKKFPVLAAAIKCAKEYIGDNNQVGMLKKTLSERGALKSLSLYLPEWKELEQWLATLSKDDRTAFEKLVFEIKDLTTKKDDNG